MTPACVPMQARATTAQIVIVGPMVPAVPNQPRLDESSPNRLQPNSSPSAIHKRASLDTKLVFGICSRSFISGFARTTDHRPGDLGTESRCRHGAASMRIASSRARPKPHSIRTWPAIRPYTTPRPHCREDSGLGQPTMLQLLSRREPQQSRGLHRALRPSRCVGAARLPILPRDRGRAAQTRPSRVAAAAHIRSTCSERNSLG